MAKANIKVKAGNTTITVKAQQKNAKTDIAKAIKLRASGSSYQEIADTQGVSKHSIYKALEKYKGQLDDLHLYSKNKDVYAELVSSKVYNAILAKDEKDIASEKLSSLGAFLKTQHEIHRLETGQSTSNVSLKIVDLTQYTGENEIDPCK